MLILNLHFRNFLINYKTFLVLFFIVPFSSFADHQQNTKEYEIAINRLYKFIEVLDKSIVNHPNVIDEFLINPSVTEGPGEGFDFIRKREKGKSYKIDYRSYRDWEKNNFRFGGFNFELIKVSKGLRDKNFSIIESKFVSLLGKPLVKKNHGDSVSMNWLFHEDKESVWYLVIKTKNYRNETNIADLKVLLNTHILEFKRQNKNTIIH